MIHLVTKKGVACGAGHGRTDSTFEASYQVKLCTCPKCQSTDVFQVELAREEERRVEITLRSSQYTLLMNAVDWAIDGLDEGKLEVYTQLTELLSELKFQENS